MGDKVNIKHIASVVIAKVGKSPLTDIMYSKKALREAAKRDSRLKYQDGKLYAKVKLSKEEFEKLKMPTEVEISSSVASDVEYMRQKIFQGLKLPKVFVHG